MEVFSHPGMVEWSERLLYGRVAGQYRSAPSLRIWIQRRARVPAVSRSDSLCGLLSPDSRGDDRSALLPFQSMLDTGASSHRGRCPTSVAPCPRHCTWDRFDCRAAGIGQGYRRAVSSACRTGKALRGVFCCNRRRCKRWGACLDTSPCPIWASAINRPLSLVHVKRDGEV